MEIQKQTNYLKYEEKLEYSREKSARLAHAADRVSLLRGIVFAIAGVLLFIGYQQRNPVFLLPVSALGISFLLLIHKHNRLEEELEDRRDEQAVLSEYMARFTGEWKRSPLDGTRYLSDDFSEAGDLDLFGKNSLYQYLCTASTVWGQDQLALWLSLPGHDFTEDFARPSLEEIRSRQQAVAELAQKEAFCMELETGARRLRNLAYDDCRNVMDHFFHALKTGPHFPAAGRILIRLSPLLTLAFLFSALLNVRRPLTMPLFLLLACGQLMSALLGFYWNNLALSPVYQMNKTVTPYRKLFQLFERASFDSSYLNALQKTCLENGTACAAFAELEAIAESVSARHNIYAFLICNALFLHDYHCMERFAKWKDRYRDSIELWLMALGKTEALISLTAVCRTRSTHCLPEIVSAAHPVLSASDIRHPLLNESAAVGNDISLTDCTCIITGSNMSGKTTFMRSIGVNLALAYAGGYCTALSLRISLMRLCTSIRTVDDVSNGISTFYAELLRIKQMITVSGKQIPMISLIDEIYKGTNSRDRIFAAKETIRKLSLPYALTLVTTHDFELCDLENDTAINAVNYHFTEHYRDNRILFDYKLKSGRCTTTNARYLLRMAGILDREEIC